MDIRINSVEEFKQLFNDAIDNGCHDNWNLETWLANFEEAHNRHALNPSKPDAFPLIVTDADIDWDTEDQCWGLEREDIDFNDYESYYDIIGHSSSTISIAINDLPW